MRLRELTNEAIIRLGILDDKINMDRFDAMHKWCDIWNNCCIEFFNEYELPTLHLWGDGFFRGDATDSEIESLIKKFNVEFEKDVYTYLECKFIEKVRPKLDKLIEEYNQFYEENKN